MKVAVLGGGPAGLYFAISMKLRDPGHEVTVIERNRADDTFGWGVVLSAETLDNLATQRSGQRRLDQEQLRLLGRHRRLSPGCAHRIDRPRLLRHRTKAPAPPAAAARQRARRRPRLPDRGRGSEAFHGNPRPRGCRRRAEFPLPRCLRGRVQARHRRAQVQIRLAGHTARSSTTPSPSSSRRPSTAGSGRMPTSSNRIRRPSSSSAARRPGRISASAR